MMLPGIHRIVDEALGSVFIIDIASLVCLGHKPQDDKGK
jgi:hypothetical protein